MEDIYKRLPLEKIPWNLETPPQALVELLEKGTIKPCRAVDLGCGAGNYAIFLAGKGFEMTGIDISPTAISIAKETANKKGVKCRFVAADLLAEVDFEDDFDFAYDWEVLHHIFPGDRKTYISNVLKMLKTGALYFSVCFSEDDPQFGGSGKYRKTPIGTELYFSSENEIRDIIEPGFEVLELKTIEVGGKTAPHRAVSALAKKKKGARHDQPHG